MEAIQIFLEKVKLGGKQSHLNMTLFPLLASDAGAPDYLILEEALNQRGWGSVGGQACNIVI
jgi:hypothetical protein